jgi:tRNA pseudouridine38-40 synthase
MTLQRYKITVSYDGSAYAGWQLQPHHTTVQQQLESAILKLAGETTKVHGSGRTDQGVHARKQVAHFDLSKMLQTSSLRKGLNALLPDDIRILRTEKIDQSFHARKSALSKEYRYFIWNAEIMPPFQRKYMTQIAAPLDISAMKTAASCLVGKHDFAAFSANPNRVVNSTVRSLRELHIRKKGNEIVITAVADGFLYKMVRSLAGFLIRVGEGKLPPSEAKSILSSRERTATVPTAPSQGLFLWNVTY